MDIAAHAYSVRTTMLSLYSLKISYVFIYKISITLLKILICLGKSILNPIQKYKKQLNKWNQSPYFLLRFTISTLFSVCSLLLGCGLHPAFLWVPETSFWTIRVWACRQCTAGISLSPAGSSPRLPSSAPSWTSPCVPSNRAFPWTPRVAGWQPALSVPR